MLSKLQQAQLKKINRELSNYGVQPIKETISRSTINKLREHAEFMRNNVMENSAFNSYHKNSDYAVAILIKEAIEILINPDDDSPYINYTTESKNRVKELEIMYENYISINGNNKKSKELKLRINNIKTSIYESETSKKLNMVLKESAGKAQTIMSAKGLQDDMIDFQAKVGDLQNKYVDSFIAMVNDEYGADMSSDIQSRLMDSLDALMTSVRKTKDDMLNIVNILSGNEKTDSILDNDDTDENMDDFDDLDLDDEDDTEDEIDLDLDDEDDEDDSDLGNNFERKK